MDGAAAVTGAGPLIELGGRKLAVRGRTVEHYGMIEAEIVNRRGNPFDALVAAARSLKDDPVALEKIAKLVAEHFRNWRLATMHDFIEFTQSPYGEAFEIWLAIRHNDPSLTPDQVNFWLMEEYRIKGREGRLHHDAIVAAINQASGAALGNSASREEIPANPSPGS